jgi:uncharacterized protein (TIGR02452 family)
MDHLTNTIKNTNIEREMRKEIYQQTKQYYQSKQIPIYESIKYKYHPTQINREKQYTIPITIYDMDTLDCAVMLKSKYDYNICILNMANPYKPGGGVEGGTTAQEESLFRRSNYFQTLNKNMYPIKDDELIYSPIVNVSRKSEKESFEFYDKNYNFAFIASCAPIDPHINDFTYQKYYRLMYNKICHILDTALLRGHDCILLGAIGCGAFNNPPDIVAKIFKDVLSNYQYDSYFKEIAFAILKNVYGKTNRSDNYDIFTSII